MPFSITALFSHRSGTICEPNYSVVLVAGILGGVIFGLVFAAVTISQTDFSATPEQRKAQVKALHVYNQKSQPSGFVAAWNLVCFGIAAMHFGTLVTKLWNDGSLDVVTKNDIRSLAVAFAGGIVAAATGFLRQRVWRGRVHLGGDDKVPPAASREARQGTNEKASTMV